MKGPKGQSMTALYKDARRVCAPILVIRTADQSATIDAIGEIDSDASLVAWDAARGTVGIGKTGGAAAVSMGVTKDETFLGFVDAMVAAQKLPKETVFFVRNAHRQLSSMEPGATAAAVQAVANVRDKFKLNFRMLVLLGPQHFGVPVELEQDVVVIDHELPDAASLATIVKEMHEQPSVGLPVPAGAEMTKVVDALTGLSTFAAEQVVAMSLRKTGIDHDALWERKRVSIEQTRGLKIYRGTETFDDIIGMGNVKSALSMKLRSKRSVGIVLVLDEIDKVLAGIEHDTNQSRRDQFTNLLTEMEDNEWEGMVLAGIPGAGKTLVAKAFGNMAGVPTIFLDLGSMEDKFVGESEANVRAAMAKIKAIGSGRAFVIATSNNSTVMRPELQRRFTTGFYWVDSLLDAEKSAAWAYYEKRYALPEQKRPADEGWTGAEIRNCARLAADCDVPLVEAAGFILPVAASRADEFLRMRMYASGRYLDAAKPGKYSAIEAVENEVTKRALRDLKLPDDKSQVN